MDVRAFLSVCLCVSLNVKCITKAFDAVVSMCTSILFLFASYIFPFENVLDCVVSTVNRCRLFAPHFICVFCFVVFILTISKVKNPPRGEHIRQVAVNVS